MGARLITGPDQGRWACQPRSVLGQLLAMRSKYKCQGVGRRETRLQGDRNAAVQGDGEQLCKRTAGQRAGDHRAAGKARERETNASDLLTAPEARKGRETNAPCPRETAQSMGAWEINMPERETAAVRRDGELLTSEVPERWQKEAAADRHQAAAGERPPLSVGEETRFVPPSATDPKCKLRDTISPY